MAESKIKLVVCWHMHQPHYRDGQQGQYRLPWVYLHALKDYTDMIWHLERVPAAKAVVNFAPVLLEQLEDYSTQLNAWLESGEPTRDELLNRLLGVTAVPNDIEGRLEWLELCQKAHAPTVIDPIERFKGLLDFTADCAREESTSFELGYLGKQYFIDIMAFYHLAWMGQSLRREDPRLKKFYEKEDAFSQQDIRELAQIILDAIENLIPRYRALMESGQIEISMTPYGHPIVPLMIDFNSIKQAMPDALMPKSTHYPNGRARASWHMEKGFEIYQQHFGKQPTGIWLSEGAVSEAAVRLLDDYDIQWTASGEGVWRHSCEASHVDSHDVYSKKALYQPLQLPNSNCHMFFRDDGMSDLIGFHYKDWAPQDAANNFAHNLENIANFLGDEVDEHVVSVILDGENAWEYYPDNAVEFLQCFYQTLSSHPRIEMTTFEQALQSGVKDRELSALKAGSWVYGSFSTWMGDPDKNLGWDLLVAAKQAYDEQIGNGRLTEEQINLATDQLAICEGSDWRLQLCSIR
jgi:alpha-amylase/alpha-mannosidase (GH57 family)